MIEADFLIESMGNSSYAVERSLNKLVEDIERDKEVELVGKDVGEVKKEEGSYTGIVELELQFSDMKSFVRGVIKYPPSAILLNSPAEITMSREEFQQLLAFTGGVIRDLYSHYHAGFVFEDIEEEFTPVDEEEIDSLLDHGAVRVGVLIENEDEDLSTIISRVIEAISGDVEYIKAEEMKLEAGRVVALDLLIEPPSSVFDLVLKYVPMVIKIVEPEEITLSMLDMQDISTSIAEVINEVMIQNAVFK